MRFLLSKWTGFSTYAARFCIPESSKGYGVRFLVAGRKRGKLFVLYDLFNICIQVKTHYLSSCLYNILPLPDAFLSAGTSVHGPPSTRVVHPPDNGSLTGSCPVWPTAWNIQSIPCGTPFPEQGAALENHQDNQKLPGCMGSFGLLS